MSKFIRVRRDRSVIWVNLSSVTYVKKDASTGMYIIHFINDDPESKSNFIVKDSFQELENHFCLDIPQ